MGHYGSVLPIAGKRADIMRSNRYRQARRYTSRAIIMARKRPQGEGSLNLSMSYKKRKPWGKQKIKTSRKTVSQCLVLVSGKRAQFKQGSFQ